MKFSNSSESYQSEKYRNKQILDVGCGTAKREGAVGIDVVDLPGVDVVHDLNVTPWPFEDQSFDVIILDDIIEHLIDTIKTMEEIYRLLKPNGIAFIKVVNWNHKYSFSDPTHVHYFTEVSFEFFTGVRRGYYMKNKFKLVKLHNVFDYRARKMIRSRKLMNFLSNYLSNIKQGMIVVLKRI